LHESNEGASNPPSHQQKAAAPEIRYIPAIIGFLGYNPLPIANTMAEQLVRHRTSLGFSQKDSARRIGVDAGTPARWERGERQPAGKLLDRVTRFIDDEERRPRSRRAG
jgi:ribosome-binding protein aMBF1 (putative translation factor)